LHSFELVVGLLFLVCSEDGYRSDMFVVRRRSTNSVDWLLVKFDGCWDWSWYSRVSMAYWRTYRSAPYSL